MSIMYEDRASAPPISAPVIYGERRFKITDRKEANKKEVVFARQSQQKDLVWIVHLETIRVKYLRKNQVIRFTDPKTPRRDQVQAVILKREGRNFSACSPYTRLVYNFEILASGNDWIEYSQKIGARKITRFIASQRRELFQTLLESSHKDRKKWRFSQTEFDASAYMTARVVPLTEKERRLFNQFLNLLREVYN